MAAPIDDAEATLPSYAALAQTQGWAMTETGIAAQTWHVRRLGDDLLRAAARRA